MDERSDARTPGLTPPRLLASADMTLAQAGASVMSALAIDPRIAFASLAVRSDDSLDYVRIAAIGDAPHAGVVPSDFIECRELLRAAEHGVEFPLAMQSGGTSRANNGRSTRSVIFPIIIGEDVRGVLFVAGDVVNDAAARADIARFCRDVALPLEILRLREDVARRTQVVQKAEQLSRHIGALSSDDIYDAILIHAAELVGSERGSLLVYDEVAGDLAVRAAIGPHTEAMRQSRVRVGDGVAGSVMRRGHPLIITSLDDCPECEAASTDRGYKTGSFISYPITLGESRYGVLNVTDKRGGGVYDELDLSLLSMIAPQLAVALSHAEWQQRATRFQLLSITDPLTDLLNRRYLEERLVEEAERSRRHGYPMSFMMIDIDDFKFYNDRNGHPAGDLALEITAQTLKSALRSVDIAARYGGEEFSVLLPQTGADEARNTAERIRRRVERTRYPHCDAQPRGSVTVSIGVATFAPGINSSSSVIEVADRALYKAKRLGKNRVESQG